MSVCPYYGRGENFCDVGADYISPHDVEAISHYCSGRYSECEKFQELVARHPEELNHQPAAARFRTDQPAAAEERKTAQVKIAFRNKWPLPYRLRYLSANNHSIEAQREEKVVMSQKTSNARGWTVVLAGTGINLALGVLYAYSMLKGEIGKLFDGAGDPYATACLAFALSMIIGGKMQDKVGPRLTAILGGILVGAGFIICSQTSSYWGWIVGFGLVAGTGFGFGYSAATPPALKWFSSAKTGLIAGIVVAGFGIAPVYLAPIAKSLLASYGLQQTMMYLGIAFVVVVCGMAMLVANPPAGFVPAEAAAKKGAPAAKKVAVEDKTPSQMLKDGRFYTCWLTYFIGAGAGLMVIGSIAGLAKQSMGEMAFIAVCVMSVGNASGRVVAGVLSDKIGRAATLTIMLVFQAALMFAAIPVVTGEGSSAVLVTLLASFIGFNYGTNLSLFPSFAKDYWGSANYGMNYGILFSAWGVGAFVLVKLSAFLSAKFGGMSTSFTVAGVMLLVGAMMALTLRPKKAAVEATETVTAEEEDLVLQNAQD
ncbi:Nitrate/nitrite transporter NarK [Malonomonas rubra DSM 5091]|uniref:Nitrate/nitrite transporter NarK n=1 Tax=Malonomonas rubra DSM 5091 TaxID=1122189 RepID=A0A1M6IW97_MALRU|nr:OFA family MFS transporter [Malonomonas rubra]SHJ38682.1 Nitrate/nitrite transporter NarK [Malonomonas rubra DSM 5091]